MSLSSSNLNLSGSNSTITMKGSASGSTIIASSNAFDSNFVLTLPAITAGLVGGPASSTLNSIPTYGNTSGNFMKNNSNLTFTSPTLNLKGSNSSISMKGSGDGTTVLSTSNTDDITVNCKLPSSSGVLAIVPSPTFYENQNEYEGVSSSDQTKQTIASFEYTPTAYGVVRITVSGFHTQSDEPTTAKYYLELDEKRVSSSVVACNLYNSAGSSNAFFINAVVRNLDINEIALFELVTEVTGHDDEVFSGTYEVTIQEIPN